MISKYEIVFITINFINFKLLNWFKNNYIYIKFIVQMFLTHNMFRSTKFDFSYKL